VDEDNIGGVIAQLSQSGIDGPILDTIKNKLKEVFKGLQGSLQGAAAAELKSALLASAKQLAVDIQKPNADIDKAIGIFGENMKGALAKAAEEASKAFGDIFGSGAVAEIQKGKNAIKGAIDRVMAGADIKLDLNMEDPTSMLKGLKDVLGTGVDFGIAKGIDEVSDKIDKADNFARRFIGSLDQYRSTAGDISKIQINPFEGSKSGGIENSAAMVGVDAARAFEKKFSAEAIDLRATIGISATDASRQLKEVYTGLENYGSQLDKGIKVTTKVKAKGDKGEDILEDKVISGAQAIVMAAQATGISVGKMTETINELTFTMGANGEQAIRSIETIAKASANTLLPVNSFSREVMTAARLFSDFGDNTEESAAMLDRFISKADPNRIGASVKAFQSVASGIAGMTDEMKAFIGMGTDLAGGGGAIESIVRLDAALQSGDKDALQGIFDEAIARIEELSGAPVMTLQEAVASGQENTFYQQVKMLEQMGLVRGSAQASDIFAASKRGAVDVEAIRSQGGTGLGTMAVEKASYGRGAVDILKEETGAAADRARFNAVFGDESVKIMETSSKLAMGLLNLGNTIAGSKDVMKALESFGLNVEGLSDATGDGAMREADRSAQRLVRNETRAITRDAQGIGQSEIRQATSSAQAIGVEEMTEVSADINNTIKAEANRVINTLGGSATGTGAGQGGHAAIDAALRMIYEAVDKVATQRLQIELKGEAVGLFRVIADDVARATVTKASTGTSQ
jgi:hypothetical protein